MAAQALHKYKQKRKNLCFTKKIRYESRKQLAQARPRVKGQFVRMAPTAAAPALDLDDSSLPPQAEDAAEALLLAAAEQGDVADEDTTPCNPEVRLGNDAFVRSLAVGLVAAAQWRMLASLASRQEVSAIPRS
jgi:hypothetical protein